MKWFLILALLIQGSFAHALPQMDLDFTSAEYDHYFETSGTSADSDEPSIAKALNVGKRLSAWLAFENQKRPENLKLHLTSASNRSSNPIESPKVNSPKVVEKNLNAALAAVPSAMLKILLANSPFPPALPVDDASFVRLGRAIDVVYQSAARWKALKPYLYQYEIRSADDVRGYYYLNKEQWNETKFANFSSLPSDIKLKVQPWLIMICKNGAQSETNCISELNQAIHANLVPDFYRQYYPKAKKNWESFFVIPREGIRSDLTWSSRNPSILSVPFNKPASTTIQDYLKNNIEAEWKTKTWNLRLNFGSFPNGPQVQFEPGALPHANAIGGNLIVMDQNQSTEEYESQWIIRHEFGHIIGFPDCYFEFYDKKLQAFVSYQIDVTDLMCSRAGNFKQRHFDELKRVYLK